VVYDVNVAVDYLDTTLDPGKGQINILLLADTTIEGASPSHARQV
jgi:hypothetical protein